MWKRDDPRRWKISPVPSLVRRKELCEVRAGQRGVTRGGQKEEMSARRGDPPFIHGPAWAVRRGQQRQSGGGVSISSGLITVCTVYGLDEGGGGRGSPLMEGQEGALKALPLYYTVQYPRYLTTRMYDNRVVCVCCQCAFPPHCPVRVYLVLTIRTDMPNILRACAGACCCHPHQIVSWLAWERASESRRTH